MLRQFEQIYVKYKSKKPTNQPTSIVVLNIRKSVDKQLK